MGRKAKWFGAVKKVFSPESRKSRKTKDKWEIEKSKQSDTSTSETFEKSAETTAPPPPAALSHPKVVVKPAEREREGEREQSKQANPVPVAAATAVEIVQPTALSKLSGKSREEAAAIKIQTAFRGHLARRALRALRGLVRLKSLIHGNSAKRQVTTTLRCMQTLARVQSQIRSRRIRMSEENQALQQQLLLKREKDLENLRMGDEWDDSLQSKEQIESSLLGKQEATIRRERALAYAFSHQCLFCLQWKNSSKSANPLFMDPNNPHWGWSWLERWMAAKTWESRSTTDKDFNSDRASMKSGSCSIGGEITNAYARRDTNLDGPSASPAAQKPVRPPSRLSPSTPTSKAPSVMGKVVKSVSPRSNWGLPDDDSRSMSSSMQSERPRRQSLPGTWVRDDESVASLASSPAVPSYMASTKSAKAKSRFQGASVEPETMTPGKGSVASVKKRLSFPVGEKNSATPQMAVRRHSGPPKVDIAPMTEENVSNGGSK